MTEQRIKTPGTSWGDVPLIGWIALAAVAAFAVAAIALTQDDSGTSDGDEYGAKDACHQFVQNRLKSPGTAKFSGETVTSNGEWTVAGSVDSQNSFGGTVRNTYTCSTTYSGGEKWQLVNLKMSAN